MNTNSLVSIIIPTFNRVEYLQNTIESCLEQTYPCEIIVCDHGSSDNTPQIIPKKYGDKIKYIRRDIDSGPHFCWLDGILRSNGKYIHLQFDDDWLEPDFIKRCVNLIDEDVGFVFTGVKLYDMNKNAVTHNFFDKMFSEGVHLSKKVENFVLNNLISPACVLYHKKDIIDALYPGNLPTAKNTYHGVGPDYFMMLLCLLRYKKFGYVPSPLAVFRSHSGSITIDALGNKEKAKKLQSAYEEVRLYYETMKFSQSKTFKIIFLLKSGIKKIITSIIKFKIFKKLIKSIKKRINKYAK